MQASKLLALSALSVLSLCVAALLMLDGAPRNSVQSPGVTLESLSFSWGEGAEMSTESSKLGPER